MKLVTKVVAYKKNVISLCCNTFLNDTTLLRESGTQTLTKKGNKDNQGLQALAFPVVT